MNYKKMTMELLSKLNNAENRLLQSLLTKKQFSKGDILIQEGTIADKMFLIETGSCRSFFIKNGEDITDFFFFEESFATDFASFCSEKPSPFNLVCQENTTAFELKKSNLEQLYKENHTFSEIGRLMAQYSFIQIEERMRLLHTENLETKYKWMTNNFPHIFQRVHQYHIASFLGVKPQSLSRIRAKIAGNIY